MSEKNGRDILKVGRMGRRWFSFGDDEPFELDVVVVYNQWTDIDAALRDDKGQMSRESMTQLNRAAFDFVRQIAGYPRQRPDGAPSDLTLAEALAFLKMLTDEMEKLTSFFVPESRKGPSSPVSTELISST